MVKLGGFAVACSMFLSGVSLAGSIPDEMVIRTFLKEQLKLGDKMESPSYSIDGDCNDGATKLPFAMDCEYYQITRLHDRDKPKSSAKLFDLMIPSGVQDSNGNTTPVNSTHQFVYYIKDQRMVVSFVAYTTEQPKSEEYKVFKKMYQNQF